VERLDLAMSLVALADWRQVPVVLADLTERLAPLSGRVESLAYRQCESTSRRRTYRQYSQGCLSILDMLLEPLMLVVTEPMPVVLVPMAEQKA